MGARPGEGSRWGELQGDFDILSNVRSNDYLCGKHAWSSGKCQLIKIGAATCPVQFGCGCFSPEKPLSAENCSKSAATVDWAQLFAVLILYSKKWLADTGQVRLAAVHCLTTSEPPIGALGFFIPHSK